MTTLKNWKPHNCTTEVTDFSRLKSFINMYVSTTTEKNKNLLKRQKKKRKKKHMAPVKLKIYILELKISWAEQDLYKVVS